MVTKHDSSGGGEPEKKPSSMVIEDPDVGGESAAEGEGEEMEKIYEPGEEPGETVGEEAAGGGFPQDVSALLIELRENIVAAMKEQMMGDLALGQVISRALRHGQHPRGGLFGSHGRWWRPAG
jgi:hypothetical protein